MLFQSGLGICINESGLSIVLLKNSFRATKVVGQAHYTLDSGKTLRERISISAELINDFIETNNVSSSDVFLCLPRESVILRDLEFPLAVKENLKSTLRYKIENYVPMKLEDIYFDYQIVEENKQANKLKILLVVVQKEILETYSGLGDRLGLGLTGISVDSTAYVNFLYRHPSACRETDYVFMHEKEERVHVGVVSNRMLLYSRSASVPKDGEEEVEKFLAGEFRQMDELVAGRPKPVKLFYMSGGRENRLLPGLDAKEAFQIEPLNSGAADISNFAMAPAMGLALRGVKKVPMEINLLPARLRKRPSRTVFYVFFALICMFLLSGLVWGGSRFMRQKMILSNLNGEIERLMVEIENVGRMRETISDLESRIDYLNGMWRGRVPLMAILKEATERIPETAWLQDFSYDQKGVQLYGYADSASELIQLLEASPLFTEVVFLSTITKDKDGKERFRIGFKIES